MADSKQDPVEKLTEEVKDVAVADNNQQADKQQKKKDKKDKKKKKQQAAEKHQEMPPPEYIPFREDIFDELYKQYRAEIESKESKPIKITLPDGKVVDGESWRTTPYDVAKSISEGMANSAVVAKVNDTLFDMTRELEEDCTIKFLFFEDEDGKEVFWHSSAHILGEAMEMYFGGHLCYGPPIANGFFYDMDMGERTVNDADLKAVEKVVNKAVKQKQPFQRLVMTKEDLLRMFEHNPFKQRIIKEKVTEPKTTVYRCGPLIDLCRGPHIRHTGQVKAFAVTKSSSSYWEGDAGAECLQRVYAISFPKKDQLKEWKKLMEEAAKRDHRKIGREQQLFFFDDLSPGSCFFEPRGARIYRTLMEFMREQYITRGFEEVVTPNIFNKRLWETSGHWQHYAENIFSFEVENETFAMKPMNCPSHCVMFSHRNRSYKELPLRMADFGVLHRNELSGALTGLTRVRRFQQDDAHIFCRPEQIEDEIKGCLAFLNAVYGTFGFTYELNLSTRPEKFLGDVEVWERAEASLAKALDEFGHEWKLNPGDGAFYGPKIDITVHDALKRSFQCATIQLDFQLPIRFNLEYVPARKEEGVVYRPVIIHRAILGSVERMFAILCEHYAGKWPFWLSPRQAQVVPIHPEFNKYAEEVRMFFHTHGFAVDVDADDSLTLQKKVRRACVEQYNFILVVGEAECKKRTVNVRTRDGSRIGELSLDELLCDWKQLRDTRAPVDTLPSQKQKQEEEQQQQQEGEAAKEEAKKDEGEKETKANVVEL
ncbi:threonyl-tRNA synthetase isoform 2 [Salpingoeca rosetta]|uniref:threonine--tRNA ligase n=1 Tax=Salpingoeca rosetta (strain ATCC 50818 / BSB-021) TaxID=946362 RepID=F2UJP0_SALR5|nr:threonyl-tRNA synthetase isoform 2 [Salpingoeca rosetta]EGD77339.1 threonyl-tRNA synthetase isoform 2 [Salpingoeca rosetta]|eukprot:XP_004990683.1 threonyl-tRNA synthetase isoform 2 [Salpingoeca rosetta]